MQNIYVVWADFQRRAVSFTDMFAFKVTHMGTGSRSRIGKLFRYLGRMVATWRLISNEKPDQVWLQIPPNFLIHVVLFQRLMSKHKFKVVADCHNASLRAPWKKVPWFVRAINQCDVILVHNEDIRKDALDLGFDSERLLVLEDAPAYNLEPTNNQKFRGSYVLVPCSFHDDEPINELLESARLCPEIEFKITGPLKKAETKGYTKKAPNNVQFTGFVSVEEYDQLVWEAGIVMGLTKLDGIQLSVAGEAVGAGRPLLLSDTSTLRKLFGIGAEFVQNTAESMANGIKLGFEDQDRMAELSRKCAMDRYQKWKSQAEVVIENLSRTDI